MNEPKPADEQNLQRLLQAAHDPAARPSPAVRDQAWHRVHAAWQASRPAPAATPAPHHVQSRSQNPQPKERTTLMKQFFNRWTLGFGAAAAAAIILLVLFTPRGQATAAEVLARGAQALAQITAIHLRGQLRTLPADNFSYINAAQDFQSVELWKQLQPDLKWRVEKPGRVALMDGQATVLYIKPAHTATKFDGPSSSAFDTDWLHTIANLSHTISNELRHAQAQGWPLELTRQTGPDGRSKDIVTVHARSGIPDDDYTKNSFLQNADTRRVYQFDDQSELLESVQIFLLKGGAETCIFQLTQIDYNPAIADTVWHLDLPADVSFYQKPQVLPDNARYAAMTPEEAARAFFEACGCKDWTEAGKFISPVNDRLKAAFGGLQIVSLGQAFTSKAYGGRFVPYEIQLPPHSFYVRVANTNAAQRFVLTGVYDTQTNLTQDFKWTGEPEPLPATDPAAQLTPAQVVQAYFTAQDKGDWAEMRKFTSAEDVDQTRSQMEAALKAGVDAKNLFPHFEVGAAFASSEPGAYFVQCTATGVRKHNLALRKDNAAGRWQVDGGL